MILVRFIVSIFLAAIALTAIYFGGIFLFVLFFVLAIYAQYEMHNVSGINKKPVLSILNYFTAVLILPMIYFFGLSGGLALIVIYVILLCIMSILQGDFSEVQKALFSFIYPQIFFMFLYMIARHSYADPLTAQFVLIFTILSAAMTDTFALFSGKLFGKHKLCPDISPKKTVEGAIGGIIMGVIITLLFSILTNEIFGVNLGILRAVCFALILSIFSEFGDLTASMIKRAYSVKDFGNLLPGHGGLLDRIDSIIFIMPVAYLLFWNL